MENVEIISNDNACLRAEIAQSATVRPVAEMSTRERATSIPSRPPDVRAREPPIASYATATSNKKPGGNSRRQYSRKTSGLTLDPAVKSRLQQLGPMDNWAGSNASLSTVATDGQSHPDDDFQLPSDQIRRMRKAQQRRD